MSLKLKVENIDDFDEATQKLYTESKDNEGNKYYKLDVDISEMKNKVDEFRENNNALKKQNEDFSSSNESMKKELSELKEKYKDIDIDKFASFIKEKKETEEAAMVKSGDIDGLVNNRVKAMKESHNNELIAKNESIEKLNKQIKEFETKIYDMEIETVVSKAINESGIKVKKGAMLDLMHRARNSWQNKNGELMALDDKGIPMIGKDAKSNVTPAEWLVRMSSITPHLFESDIGAGSTGGVQRFNKEGKKEISLREFEDYDKIEDIASGKVVVNTKDL